MSARIREALARHIDEDAIPTLQSLKIKCPDPVFVAIFYNNLVRELREQQADLLTADTCLALITAFANGFRTDVQLATETRIHISEVRRNMQLLAADGYFIQQDMVWKQTTARGIRAKEWKRTAKPLPPELTGGVK
jgi:hypothetical protein